jgi:hypothetical protein
MLFLGEVQQAVSGTAGGFTLRSAPAYPMRFLLRAFRGSAVAPAPLAAWRSTAAPGGPLNASAVPV